LVFILVFLKFEKEITAYRLKYENKISLSSVNYVGFWAKLSCFQRKIKKIQDFDQLKVDYW